MVRFIAVGQAGMRFIAGIGSIYVRIKISFHTSASTQAKYLESGL